MEGCVGNWDKLFSQVFHHLAPGGYFEISSLEINSTSDDGIHLNTPNFCKFNDVLHEASRKFGKPMDTAPLWKGKVEKAGFNNVTEKILKVSMMFFFMLHKLILKYHTDPT